MDIVCRAGGFAPNAVVIVATAKALKHHAGLEETRTAADSLRAIEEGSANLARHIRTPRSSACPAWSRPTASPATPTRRSRWCKLALEHGAHAAALNEGFSKGGAGAAEMAEAVADACEQPTTFNFMYEDSDPDLDVDRVGVLVDEVEGVRLVAGVGHGLGHLGRAGAALEKPSFSTAAWAP